MRRQHFPCCSPLEGGCPRPALPSAGTAKGTAYVVERETVNWETRLMGRPRCEGLLAITGLETASPLLLVTWAGRVLGLTTQI